MSWLVFKTIKPFPRSLQSDLWCRDTQNLHMSTQNCLWNRNEFVEAIWTEDWDATVSGVRGKDWAYGLYASCTQCQGLTTSALSRVLGCQGSGPAQRSAPLPQCHGKRLLDALWRWRWPKPLPVLWELLTSWCPGLELPFCSLARMVGQPWLLALPCPNRESPWHPGPQGAARKCCLKCQCC